MSEWEVVAAGAVATQRKDVVTLAPGVEYRTMGVRWYGKGAYDRGIGTTETIKAKRLFRAHEGDFVFNRIDTQNGAFDVVPAELDGAVATNEFPFFVTDPDRLLARFLLLYFQQPSVLAQIDAMRAGSEGRSRWKEADFEAWRIPVPSVAEQRRIVEVLSAVDAQIEALTVQAEQAERVWAASVASLDRIESQSLLDDVLDTIEAGRSPKGVERVPGANERAVLKISAVGRARFNPTEVKTVSSDVELRESSRVHKGDVLLVRCNAVLERVGVVCQVYEEPANLFLCDKTLRLVPRLSSALPEYLANAMAAPSVRRQIEERTAGSDMRNIGQKALREIRVPLPELDEQLKQGAALTALVRNGDGLRDELTHLRAFRSALLTALLNQEIEIPESYDQLLGAVS